MSIYVESRTRQAAVKVTIGKVVTLPAGSQAYVKNVGTVDDMILEFGIPHDDQGLTGVGQKGDKGDSIVGPTGAASTVPGPQGISGKNGLTQEEIEAVVAKALAESRAELKKACDQQIAASKAKLDQLHEAAKKILCQ